MNNLFEKLKKPSGKIIALSTLLTVLTVGGSMVFLFIPELNKTLEILSYVCFGFSALFFGYSVYLVVIFIPHAKERTVNLLKGWRVTREFLESFGFRTMVGVTLSLGVSIAYGLFNGVFGIIYGSVWYGALSAYYICLTLIRAGVVNRNKKVKKYIENKEYKTAKTYRNSGIVLLLLNVALSFAIAQMIFEGMGYEYPGLLIYVHAAYTFTKIGTAIYNFVKAQKQTDLTVEAARDINLVDGAVSILALQTAMLASFGDGTMDISLTNTLTGSAVSIFAYFMAIFMIVKGNKTIKKLKSEKKDGQ